jgi:hypothetical protein
MNGIYVDFSSSHAGYFTGMLPCRSIQSAAAAAAAAVAAAAGASQPASQAGMKIAFSDWLTDERLVPSAATLLHDGATQ